jgi:hypothetical protein
MPDRPYRSWSSADFPNLTADTCEITSPAKKGYNCIAWAAGNNRRNWWPAPPETGAVWPAGVPREVTFDAFIKAYRTLGYEVCDSAVLEQGVEKIAIFGKLNADGLLEPTHAALQLASGEWTSKLGKLEDVRHVTLDGVEGRMYGTAMFYMARPRVN